MVTVIELGTRVAAAHVAIGVEPEGMSVSPDSKILVCTSETTITAHFIDTESLQVLESVLLGSRPRFASFKADG